MIIELATVTILIFHVPTSGAEIGLNPKKIVSMRDGEHKGQYFTDAVGCIINTDDGKFTSVMETCAEVRKLMEAAK